MATVHLRIKPVHAKALVCVLGLLVFVVDMVVPADLDVAIFYSFVVVLCAVAELPVDYNSKLCRCNHSRPVVLAAPGNGASLLGGLG